MYRNFDNFKFKFGSIKIPNKITPPCLFSDCISKTLVLTLLREQFLRHHYPEIHNTSSHLAQIKIIKERASHVNLSYIAHWHVSQIHICGVFLTYKISSSKNIGLPGDSFSLSMRASVHVTFPRGQSDWGTGDCSTESQRLPTAALTHTTQSSFHPLTYSGR